MLAAPTVSGGCHRCAKIKGQAVRSSVARRRLLKAAVFPRADQAPPAPGHTDSAHTDSAAWVPATAGTPVDGPDASMLPPVVSGTVLDISPQVLVVAAGGAERRFTLSPDANVWRGAQLEPTALRPGDAVVIRVRSAKRRIADAVWANIGRVTGEIVERAGNVLVVREGFTQKPRVVAIRRRFLGRIQVRFPVLAPGYLIDVIGLLRDGELDAMVTASAQPAYPVGKLPRPVPLTGHVPDAISGSATWHEPAGELLDELGVHYPALDQETGCAEDARGGWPGGSPQLPYLALGSVLRVHNDCTGTNCLLPVTGCAPADRLFHDRCVTCGTSPRGRIADLTMTAFVALGGELERGCFNATITIGE
jgi:hypothetical protein